MQFTSFLEDGNLTVVLTGEIDHHCAKHYIMSVISFQFHITIIWMIQKAEKSMHRSENNLC